MLEIRRESLFLKLDMRIADRCGVVLGLHYSENREIPASTVWSQYARH